MENKFRRPKIKQSMRTKMYLVLPYSKLRRTNVNEWNQVEIKQTNKNIICKININWKTLAFGQNSLSEFIK